MYFVFGLGVGEVVERSLAWGVAGLLSEERSFLLSGRAAKTRLHDEVRNKKEAEAGANHCAEHFRTV